MNKKIIGILICALLITTSLSIIIFAKGIAVIVIILLIEVNNIPIISGK